MKKVRIGKFSFSDPCWSNISDKAKDLISQLLTYDVDKRPSAEQALQHPWITEFSSGSVDANIAMGALSNLKTFRADQKLKQATFAFIASQLLSKQEKENLARIFKAIDKNGDGKLSKEEILEGYDLFFGKHLDKDEVEKMFDAVDIDRSGFIDYSEFVIAAMNEKQLLTNEKLQSAFKMFDKDGSGMISAVEIKEVLGFGKTLSEEAVNEIVKQVDANGDGEISFEEFAQMMRRLSA
jgi:calcium-dependent protein kinase